MSNQPLREALDKALQDAFLTPYEEPITPTVDRLIEALPRYGLSITVGNVLAELRADIEALSHSGTVWTGDPLLNRKDVLALVDARLK